MKSSEHIREGEKAYAEGRYGEAIKHFRTALEKLERMGRKNEALAMTVNNLAASFRAEGKHEEAEPLLKGCIVICEEVLGHQHPDTAVALNNLASLYFDQGRQQEAEPLYIRALEILRQHRDSEHPHTAIVIKGLTRVYEELNQPEKAQALETQTNRQTDC